MVVLDGSAAIRAVSRRPKRLIERLAREDLHAPHLLDLEVLNGLHGLVRGRKLSSEMASYACAEYLELSVTRYPHEPLTWRIWALRDNLTAYDAAYVALAELLEAPLLTCDARLTAGAASTVRIELFD
jgi:predicted nucleic acid-binding protein